jgi:hypothetical protein
MHPSIPSGAVARRQTQLRKTVPIVSTLAGRKLAVAKSVSQIIDVIVLVDVLIQHVCNISNFHLFNIILYTL